MLEHLQEVSVDTLFLVAKLTRKEIEEIQDHIQFDRNWKSNSTFNYILVSKEPSFRAYLEPRFGTQLFLNGSYNIMIHMHRDALKAKPMLIKWLLGFGNWKVKVIHIAYDWDLAFSRHFVLKNDNVKVERRKGKPSYYLYSKKSNPCFAFVYDKKIQLIEHKNIQIPIEHLTRFEIRIRPILKKAPLNDLLWIKDYMKKFIFIPDCEVITRSLVKDQDKEAFEKVRRRKLMDWRGISKRSKQRIRDLCRVAAVNFFGVFQRYKPLDGLF
jgi:hypothetical protein